MITRNYILHATCDSVIGNMGKRIKNAVATGTLSIPNLDVTGTRAPVTISLDLTNLADAKGVSRLNLIPEKERKRTIIMSISDDRTSTYGLIADKFDLIVAAKFDREFTTINGSATINVKGFINRRFIKEVTIGFTASQCGASNEV